MKSPPPKKNEFKVEVNKKKKEERNATISTDHVFRQPCNILARFTEKNSSSSPRTRHPLLITTFTTFQK